MSKGKPPNSSSPPLQGFHPPASAREASARRLADQARRWPDFVLAPMGVDRLDSRDAALAHAIYDAAMRRWLTLEWLLNQFLQSPLTTVEPALQGVLLSGAAQLTCFDRVPVHSAIDETVELSKSLVRAGAAGITNAVLRRVADCLGDRTSEVFEGDWPPDRLPLSDGTAVMLKGVSLSDDWRARLGIATSTPAWLLKRWAMRRPRHAVHMLAMHGLIAAPTILNTRYATSPLPDDLSPHSQRGSHCFNGSRDQLADLLASRTDIWVQDPASQRPIAEAAARLDQPPSLIMDLCAGQGTKTRQLAAAIPNARIVATDTDDRRLRTLAETFAGSEQVEVISPSDVLLKYHGKADLILLDVPCTNTGVLSRRIEAKYRCDDEQLKRLTDLQKQIIADSIPLLRSRPSRGRILYSTCSLEPEENQSQADWASRWHSFRVAGFEAVDPTGKPGGPSDGYSDGSFWALLG